MSQAGDPDGESLARTLADLVAAQTRLHGLDDDFYLQGYLAEGRYPIPARSGRRPTSSSDGSSCASWSSA